MGATYISLENSMVLQHENSNRRVNGILERDDVPDIPVTFNKNWSSEYLFIICYGTYIQYIIHMPSCISI